MKYLVLFVALFLFVVSVNAQDAIRISFSNDSKDVYHLSLVIYTPDGKIQTRVSDLTPGQIKTYSLPVTTEIFIANRNQEAFAMRGNDIKSTGVKPYLVLRDSDNETLIQLSSLAKE